MNEDILFEVALDAGAEDINEDGSNCEILTKPEFFQVVQDALSAKNIQILGAEIGMIPQNSVKLDGKQAKQMLKLMDSLENHEDVTNVWANFDLSEEEFEAAML